MKKLFAVAAAVLAGTAMLAFAGCDSQNGSLAELSLIHISEPTRRS